MSVAISCRTAKKQESTEWQKIGVNDPLQIAGARLECGAQGRQTNIDDRTIDECEARRQDSRRQHPVWTRRIARQARLRSNASVATYIDGVHCVMQFLRLFSWVSSDL